MELRHAMGALGALVGLFIAWSASSVVTNLLPLMFGLLGGAAGLSVLQLDLNDEGNKQKVKLLGASVGYFSIACGLFTILGVLSRPAVAALGSPPRYELKVDHSNSNADAYLRDLMQRRKLEAIGASNTEIEHFFDMSRQRELSAWQRIQDIRGNAEQFSKAFETTIDARKDIVSAEITALHAHSKILVLQIDEVDRGNAPSKYQVAKALDIFRRLQAYRANEVLTNEGNKKLFAADMHLASSLSRFLLSIAASRDLYRLAHEDVEARQLDEMVKVSGTAGLGGGGGGGGGNFRSLKDWGIVGYRPKDP